MRAASSTWVSLRCRRSWRILRPTSSSCAGLFMRGFVDFYAAGTINFGQSTDLLPRCQVLRVPKTYKNVHLLRELVKRDFHARFTGSALGVLWAVLQPLSLVILYWFVFTYMFRRCPAAENKNSIAFLIAGLLPCLAFNPALPRPPTPLSPHPPLSPPLSF